MSPVPFQYVRPSLRPRSGEGLPDFAGPVRCAPTSILRFHRRVPAATPQSRRHALPAEQLAERYRRRPLEQSPVLFLLTVDIDALHTPSLPLELMDDNVPVIEKIRAMELATPSRKGSSMAVNPSQIRLFSRLFSGTVAVSI